MQAQPKRIVISKPTAMGDVVLALPMATVLKQINPKSEILFLGRQYTRELIEAYQDVDQFLDWDSFKILPIEDCQKKIRQFDIDAWIHITADPHILKVVKQAKIPIRVGDVRRISAWRYCNHWVNVSRRKSFLHEAQYDHQFLTPFGSKVIYSQHEIVQNYHFKPLPELPTEISDLLEPNRFRLILHPKSHGKLKGYAWDWPEKHFLQLIQQLPESEYQILVTGSPEEGEQLQSAGFFGFSHTVNLCGRLTVGQLMRCIQESKGLIAGSTGPMHLGAALGVKTLGLFSPRRPFNTLRWGPLGKQAQALEPVNDCLRLHSGKNCHCIETILPETVKAVVSQWKSQDRIM